MLPIRFSFVHSPIELGRSLNLITFHLNGNKNTCSPQAKCLRAKVPVVFLRESPRQHSICAVLDRPAAELSEPEDINDSAADAQLIDRQKSHAEASSSNGSIPLSSTRSAPQKQRLKHSDATNVTPSNEVLSLSGPPRLVRPRPPRDNTHATTEELGSASTPPEQSSGTPVTDRGPAAERVYWRGSVLSREAVLGRVLVRLPSGRSVAEVLQGQMLCSKQITRLLSWLGHEGRVDLALAAFDWLDSRPEYTTEDRFLYTRLMSMSARQPDGAAKALAIFDRMCAAGIQLDVVAFNAAIGAAGKAGNWERVLQLYREMQQLGEKPDVWTFSALMAACQACGNRWKSALEFLDQMESAGIKGNVVLYTTLMSVCRRGGQLERAMSIFRTMETDGVQLDVVAYNQAMASCSWEQAWSCFNAMRRAGVQPNTRSYNALLAACERDGEADRALEAFARMEREAARTYGYVEPSLVTYNTLISACGKAGKYTEALELAAAMRARGYLPDSFTVCSLVAAAGTAGQWRSALATFQDFCASGRRPSTAAYNALIRALGQGGEPARALAVFEGMRSGQPPAAGQAAAPPPNARTWAAVIGACRSNGRWREVLRLYHDMCDSEFIPDGNVLQTVISACERAGAWEEADAVFQRMEQAGLLADMDGLALATRRVLYKLPTLVAGPLMTTAHLAVDSGRAARRWINRPAPTAAE